MFPSQTKMLVQPSDYIMTTVALCANIAYLISKYTAHNNYEALPRILFEGQE